MLHFSRTANYSKFRFCTAIALLAVFWFPGLFLGYCVASDTHSEYFSLMRMAPLCRVSIVGVFVMQIFPLLITAAFMRFLTPLSILPIVFLKAFSFSYCACLCTSAFGSAGWLIRSFVFFSDTFTIVVLLWFCLRQLTMAGESLQKDITVSIIIVAAIGCVDYFTVSPFLLSLFGH